ncbi:hypothetical protein [Lactococcus garvieae]|uniref:DUF3801 domain-containing protein n=1 Tax=Lactococcus garvieae TaxID=1363 RepID=A0A1I4GII4_9LACT|nr:hypothetical protein [Lactococcus garvieae]SFL29001.1 hypothetical protein SAMN05216438_10418 [Lactococcus garvieae]
MEEQQEFWQIIKGTPRNINQLIHLLQYAQKQLSKLDIGGKKAEAARKLEAEKAEKLAPGEKTMDFMQAAGRSFAPPAVYNDEVNLDKLKTLLTEEYKIQFHINPIENGQMEFHFFGKDAKLVDQALTRAVTDIVKHPEKVSGKSKDLDADIKEAKTKQAVMREHQAAQKADKAADKAATKATEKGSRGLSL